MANFLGLLLLAFFLSYSNFSCSLSLSLFLTFSLFSFSVLIQSLTASKFFFLSSFSILNKSGRVYLNAMLKRKLNIFGLLKVFFHFPVFFFHLPFQYFYSVFLVFSHFLFWVFVHLHHLYLLGRNYNKALHFDPLIDLMALKSEKTEVIAKSQ